MTALEYDKRLTKAMKAIVAGVIVFGAVAWIGAWYVSGSFIYATLFALACYGVVRVFFAFSPDKKVSRRAIKTAMGAAREDVGELPVVELFQEGSGWCVGFGRLNNRQELMAVKAKEIGVSVAFAALRDRPPMILPWDRIGSLSVEASCSQGEPKEYARLKVDEDRTELVVPWSADFNPYAKRYMSLLEESRLKGSR